MPKTITVPVRVDSTTFDAALERLRDAGKRLSIGHRLKLIEDVEPRRTATVDVDLVNRLVTLRPSPYLEDLVERCLRLAELDREIGGWRKCGPCGWFVLPSSAHIDRCQYCDGELRPATEEEVLDYLKTSQRQDGLEAVDAKEEPR